MVRKFDPKLVDEIVDKLQRFAGSSCTCVDCAKAMAPGILNLFIYREIDERVIKEKYERICGIPAGDAGMNPGEFQLLLQFVDAMKAELLGIEDESNAGK